MREGGRLHTCDVLSLFRGIVGEEDKEGEEVHPFFSPPLI